LLGDTIFLKVLTKIIKIQKLILFSEKVLIKIKLNLLEKEKLKKSSKLLYFSVINLFILFTMGNYCIGEPPSNPNLSSHKSSLHIQGSSNSPVQKNSISNAGAECKVVILGDSAVGKTSIAMRFIENRFPESHVVTLGAKFQQPKVQLKNGATLRINLWDTSGEEKFRSMLPIYFRNINGAILAYDIGDRKSFESVEYWLNVLDSHVKKDNIVIYLVGNKRDLLLNDRKVDPRVAQTLAENNGMMFTEVSAKTGEGVNEVFRQLAEELVKKFKF